MANAEIVAIGSELLLGQIVDTNSSWMAERLTNFGVNLFHKTIVGDNPKRMTEVLNLALDRSDIVITGGGLGPTQDDLTREVVAEVTGRELILDNELLTEIDKRFRSRGFIMTSNNERQAYIPDGAIPVHNPNGTAPSFIVEDPRGVVFSLPGVPHELKWLFDNEVVPYLRKKFDLNEMIIYKVLKVSEMGESSVDDRIGHLIANSSNPTVGVLAHPGQVDVRIAAKAKSTNEAYNLIAPVEDEIRNLLGKHIFAVDDESMEDSLGKVLDERGLTISVYEDLTAGMVAHRFQDASLKYFLEGIVGNRLETMEWLLSKSPSSKNLEDLLNTPELLTSELALSVRHHSGSDLGVAVHVIPEEGDKTENLGRGNTFISIADGRDFTVRKYNFGGRGLPDKSRISMNAVDLVRSVLLENGNKK